MTSTTRVFRIYIKATPQAVWNAITDPDWNQRYGYGSPSEYELRPGGAYRALATPEMRTGELALRLPAVGNWIFQNSSSSAAMERPLSQLVPTTNRTTARITRLPTVTSLL